MMENSVHSGERVKKSNDHKLLNGSLCLKQQADLDVVSFYTGYVTPHITLKPLNKKISIIVSL